MTLTDTGRIVTGQMTNPVDGTVRWAPAKSLWLTAMSLTALVADR